MNTRKIKFRAWDGQKIIDNFQDHKDWACAMERSSEEYGGYILMQFTGLFDKKGKEIYEGDIIQLLGHKVTVNTDVDIEEVYFDIYEGGFYHTYRDRPSKRFWKYAEVIGNVYQNSKLLK